MGQGTHVTVSVGYSWYRVDFYNETIIPNRRGALSSFQHTLRPISSVDGGKTGSHIVASYRPVDPFRVIDYCWG